MSLKMIDAGVLAGWVNDLIRETKVIAPQAKRDRFDFGDLSDASELRLDYDVSLTPPNKVCFQPPEEVIARFKGAEFESNFDDEPFVLLGVHPYDMVAINQMDAIFTQDNCDAHYVARRNASTIVVVDVQSVSENVFAGPMGTATVEEGFDVRLTKIDDGYVVESQTDKGDDLIAGLADASEPTDEQLAAREQVGQKNRTTLAQHDLKWNPDELPELLEDATDHSIWEEKADLCFSCGSCTNVCPTCYCFDVQDDIDYDLESGERKRAWDGCQLMRFARVAGGHNFREEKAARYRHRYYRKGKYVPDMIGECACVGCGRCITACVAEIADPPEVFNRLKEEH